MQSKHDLIVEPVGLEIESLPRPIDWAALFGNAHPVEIEIGMGKGTFITDQAKARPQTNFFGLEYARFFWRYASDRLRRNNCANARTARAEASFFLNEFVPPQSVSVLHIYFPDPWPKKRHNKRRLVTPAFMQLTVRILVPGGQVRIVTDHEEYFQQIDASVRGSTLRPIEYNRPGSAAEGEFVGTNFERKYQREGRPFHAIAAAKPD